MTTLSLQAEARSPLLERSLPYLAFVGSMLSFCVGTSFAKRLFPLIGAEGTASLRVGFSALILLAVFRPWRTDVNRADLIATMRYGAALGCMNLCFYMALRTIPLGLSIAIEFLGPLSVALVHSHRPIHFVTVAFAAIGLALLLPLHRVHHALDPVGVAFALGAGVCWALYIVFGKRMAHMPSGTAVALGMSTAALIVVPIGVHASGAGLLAPSAIAIGLVVAMLSSAIPYSLELVALKHIPANRYGVLASIDPAIGALAGMMMLGEHLFPLQWLAIALVMAASAVSVATGETPR